MAEKMRVHILAKELNVPSKTIIEKCKAEGITAVKNHMSTLGPGLHATIREWFSEDSEHTAVETAEKVDLDRVRLKRRRKKKTAPAAEETPADKATAVAELDRDEIPSQPEDDVRAAAAATGVDVVAEAPVAEDESEIPEGPDHAPVTADTGVEQPAVAAEQPETVTGTAVAEPPPAEPEAPTTEALEEEPALEEPLERETSTAADLAAEAPAVEPPPTEPGVPATEGEAPEQSGEAEFGDRSPEEPPAIVAPAGPQNVPTKAKLQGPRVVRYEAPDRDLPAVRPGAPRSRRSPDQDYEPGRPPPVGPGGDKPHDKGPGKRRGRLSPRRAAGRGAEVGERSAEWGDRDLAERRERLKGATGRRIHRRRSAQAQGGAQPGLLGPKTEAKVYEPVHMKEFCAATGLNFMQCFKVLKDEHNLMANVNMTLPTE
ncbi:MAG: translation initiation factor IF-2 N-terminal domain-containing protein, partial [Phycisphaerae bacterium]